MNEQKLPPAESYSERDIADAVKDLHAQFLELVPEYDKQIWDPRVALREHSGSCMAELLYVAGGLLVNGMINEQDITIGFSKDHGKEHPTGFVGKTGKKYAHTFMLITIGNGVTLEMDFRANRADESPRLQRLLPDELDIGVLYLGDLASAIVEYASIEGVSGPTVDELISLHTNNEPGTQTTELNFKNTDEIKFDEDF